MVETFPLSRAQQSFFPVLVEYAVESLMKGLAFDFLQVLLPPLSALCPSAPSNPSSPFFSTLQRPGGALALSSEPPPHSKTCSPAPPLSRRSNLKFIIRIAPKWKCGFSFARVLVFKFRKFRNLDGKS